MTATSRGLLVVFFTVASCESALAVTSAMVLPQGVAAGAFGYGIASGVDSL